MSKRSATQLQTASSSESKKPFRGASKNAQDDDMGEFEDGWEDEFESDEEVVDGTNNDGAHISKTQFDELCRPVSLDMEVDEDVLPPIEESDEQPPAPDVFIPGVHQLGKDEILEADESVYIMRHSMNVNWPCLSFDILRDNLGDERQRLPATAYIVTGTQADAAKNNEISVYKMSSLHKTQRNEGMKPLRSVHDA